MTVTRLADIPERAITPRDRDLLVWLAAVKVTSESQLTLHFWPNSPPAAARRRLRQLSERYRLLQVLDVATETVTRWGLTAGPVYELSPLGRDWLHRVAGAEPGYQSKPAQYVHDLLVAEISLRLVEAARQRGEGWQAMWYGEADIRPFAPDALLPDGLGLLRQPDGSTAFAFFLEFDASRESHGRYTSQIGRKIGAYEQYARKWVTRPGPVLLPHFPPIVFITHGAQRFNNLSVALPKLRRRRPLACAVARFDTLRSAGDMLNAPVWRLLPVTEDQSIRADQPLLGATDWFKPQAASVTKSTTRSKLVSHQRPKPAASASPASTMPAKSRPATQTAVKPAPTTRVRPTRTTPVSQTTTTQATAAIPIVPPYPSITERPVVPVRRGWWPGFRRITLTFLLVLIIANVQIEYGAQIDAFLHPTPTPTPTATPDLFKDVPHLTY